MSQVVRLPTHQGAQEAPGRPGEPEAPEHLSERSRALWGSVVGSWALEAHQLRLLEEACVALDRSAQAREAIEVDGAFITDRFGVPKAHPGVAVERDARIAAARLFRELNLNLAEAEGARPPRHDGRRS